MSEDNAVYTEEYKGCTIRIEVDDDPPNPRKEWDNLGQLLCLHSRYDLGDEHKFRTPEEIQEYVGREAAICLPLYLYDHGGISISTGSFIGRAPNAEWDSGMVGYAIITRAAILKEYDCKRISRKVRALAQSVLEGEVKNYDTYLRGDVYGYVVDLPDGDRESCWGFFGDYESDALPEARGMVDYHVQKAAEEEAARLKAEQEEEARLPTHEFDPMRPPAGLVRGQE